ncbi:unnamed protein product [Bursaphelenchus xylophilus]|uniref:(pine wood nematode) hypothetical protein n=1 Tax=Bursaphelenchus xylophilus TaxID=6326 RepID=A0A1I7SUP3_BURXY|nr:unnamed protein product [Bursaphelenchus xylophilus]CAG9125981.1 unnamed protein product [Bursaphelenchus xylophilus]
MIESCTTRRMLLLICALLVSSTIILVFEEYVEDSELEASRRLKQNGKMSYSDPDSKKDVPKTSTSECSPESLKLVEECQPCSNFEVNALKTDYCKDTGFYTKFLCEATNQTLYSPCYSKQVRAFVRFNLFAGMSFAWSVLFYGFVSWRRKIVEMRSYSRVSQFIN